MSGLFTDLYGSLQRGFLNKPNPNQSKPISQNSSGSGFGSGSGSGSGSGVTIYPIGPYGLVDYNYVHYDSCEGSLIKFKELYKNILKNTDQLPKFCKDILIHSFNKGHWDIFKFLLLKTTVSMDLFKKIQQNIDICKYLLLCPNPIKIVSNYNDRLINESLRYTLIYIIFQKNSVLNKLELTDFIYDNLERIICEIDHALLDHITKNCSIKLIKSFINNKIVNLNMFITNATTFPLKSIYNTEHDMSTLSEKLEIVQYLYELMEFRPNDNIKERSSRINIIKSFNKICINNAVVYDSIEILKIAFKHTYSNEDLLITVRLIVDCKDIYKSPKLVGYILYTIKEFHNVTEKSLLKETLFIFYKNYMVELFRMHKSETIIETMTNDIENIGFYTDYTFECLLARNPYYDNNFKFYIEILAFILDNSVISEKQNLIIFNFIKNNGNKNYNNFLSKYINYDKKVFMENLSTLKENEHYFIKNLYMDHANIFSLEDRIKMIYTASRKNNSDILYSMLNSIPKDFFKELPKDIINRSMCNKKGYRCVKMLLDYGVPFYAKEIDFFLGEKKIKNNYHIFNYYADSVSLLELPHDIENIILGYIMPIKEKYIKRRMIGQNPLISDIGQIKSNNCDNL